jgi:hypothetical protein
MPPLLSSSLVALGDLATRRIGLNFNLAVEKLVVALDRETEAGSPAARA